MTNMKKKILAVSLVISVIAILSMGTLAWFQDDDSVTNKFQIADSDGDSADEIFGVDVFEWVDEDGDGQLDESEKKDGITYDEQQVIPGAELEKKAYVHNTGKYDQYIRVTATLTDAREWCAALGVDPTDLENSGLDLGEIFVVDADFDNWWKRDSMTYNSTDNTITYVYYYNGILAPDARARFINAVKIPGDLDVSDVVAMNGSFDLGIKAEAIQTVNMPITYSDTDFAANAKASFGVVDVANP